MIAIADQTANLFKDSFQRLRPCYNESLISFVRLVKESCGGKYGFFSAHASNSFSLAVFFGLLFKNKFRFIIYMTLFYASLISFSRIYLGVHFPLDIFFGGVYGIITGLVIFRIYENRLNFFKFLNKS
jgi:undecaprenyl-diphosphatase